MRKICLLLLTALLFCGCGIEKQSPKKLKSLDFTVLAPEEMPEELRGKYQYYTKADLTKLRKAGYTAPMTSLEDGVRQYVQQYLNEEDMYK